MVALNLSNITALIAAAGGVFNIVDFQGNCVDAPGGRTDDFTGIETYTCVSSAANQKWSLNAVGSSFQITVANVPTAVLSMPLVGTATPPPQLIYQQAAVRTSSIMTWQVAPNSNFPGKFNIISTFANPFPGVALTAWAKRLGGGLVGDLPSAPLTITGVNLTDVQQTFTLVSTS